MHRRTVVGLSLRRHGNGLSSPDGKPPGLEPDIGALAKYCRYALQRYFGIPKTDTVTNTQVNLPGTDPAVVAVHECAVARTGIIDGDKTVIGQFNAGMQTGQCRVINDKIAGWITSA